MTATAVVGSAAEDTTPSEREAPARFAWWHPQSADLGRRAEAIGFGMSIFAAACADYRISRRRADTG